MLSLQIESMHIAYLLFSIVHEAEFDQHTFS